MNFKDFAKRHTSGSAVLQGREKIETDALIAKYPDGVTITAFDFLNSTDGGHYVVCAFAEDPKVYFNGGKILTEMFEGIVFEFENHDLDKARTEYENAEISEKIRVRLSHARSKKGNKYTKVEALD